MKMLKLFGNNNELQYWIRVCHKNCNPEEVVVELSRNRVVFSDGSVIDCTCTMGTPDRIQGRRYDMIDVDDSVNRMIWASGGEQQQRFLELTRAMVLR